MAMTISEAENRIRDSLEIQSVAKLRKLPFESYEEIQTLYRAGKLVVGCRMNENLIDNFGTKGERVMDRILLTSPIAAILASIIAAIFRSQYLLLLGIPLALLGMFMTTPAIMRSGAGLGGTVLIGVFMFFAFHCYRGNFTHAFLTGSYWVPNLLLSASRELNRSVMTTTVMSSELLFLYYYLRDEIWVQRK